MDSLPAPSQRQGRAQRLFRVKGQSLLHGCSALGETARPVDPRPAENLRHGPRGDRRTIRRDAGAIARLWPEAFKKFFLREFEADQPEAVARLIADLGLSDG